MTTMPVETVAGPPATTSHVECTSAEREAMGIPETLIRYSVGIEDPDDLIRDLTQALDAVAQQTRSSEDGMAFAPKPLYAKERT